MNRNNETHDEILKKVNEACTEKYKPEIMGDALIAARVYFLNISREKYRDIICQIERALNTESLKEFEMAEQAERIKFGLDRQSFDNYVRDATEENERLRKENTHILHTHQIRSLERSIASEMLNPGISHAQWERLDKIATVIQDIIKTNELNKIKFCPGCDEPVNQCTGQYEDCQEGRGRKTDEKILCAACGHWIEKVGTKWHHTESAPIEYSESPTNKGQPHADIKYRELCYHCPCITPTPPSVRTVCPVG